MAKGLKEPVSGSHVSYLELRKDFRGQNLSMAKGTPGLLTTEVGVSFHARAFNSLGPDASTEGEALRELRAKNSFLRPSTTISAINLWSRAWVRKRG